MLFCQKIPSDTPIHRAIVEYAIINGCPTLSFRAQGDSYVRYYICRHLDAVDHVKLKESIRCKTLLAAGLALAPSAILLHQLVSVQQLKSYRAIERQSAERERETFRVLRRYFRLHWTSTRSFLRIGGRGMRLIVLQRMRTKLTSTKTFRSIPLSAWK